MAGSQLTYDPSAVFLDKTGITPQELAELAPRLNAARQETLDDVELWKKHDNSAIPADKQPLDAGFIDLPERLLDEYDLRRDQSELDQILSTGKHLAAKVDRVVVLGIGGSYMGTRALFEACCHPYHNDLGRAERGSHPRIYFEGNNVDNDALNGLLDLLGRGKPASRVAEDWGLIIVSKSGGTLETAAATRIMLRVLREAVQGDPQELAKRVAAVTGASGKLFNLATALGCSPIFNIPDGVGGRFSIFTAVGLLPATVLGLDVRKLLEGAADMNRRFRSAPPGENPVLDFVGVGHLMEVKRGATIRVLSTWGKGLEAVGLWYDQLLSESLGKQEHGATPITVVNTRDLHSRGQQHQEGRRDKLITNVIVDSVRTDRVAIGKSDYNQDELNALAPKTLPEVLTAALLGTNQAYREDGRPTVDLHLPALDEYSLGQLLQMLMLATVVEGRILGINPYGQPGVEGYKKHMTAFLRK